ncbi:MAG TPA: response regulator [bacterium]|nr:response regulator [bacterium]HOL35557.1 response regulator [bacterium]HPP08330.1 response regulator [bacterium]
MKYVMIVVEDTGIANALKVLLKDKFLPFVVTADSACQSIAQRKPDIVIIDSVYSSRSGYELAGEILKLIPDIPVIALVDSYGPITRRLMNLGVYEVIEKPFDPERFMYTLNRAAAHVEIRRPENSEAIQDNRDKTSLVNENTFFQKLSELIAENFSVPERLIYAILNLLRTQFSLSGVSLFIRKNEEFVFFDGIGVEKVFLNNVRFNPGTAIYKWLMSERKIIQKHHLYSSELVSEMNLLQADLVLPLLNRDGLALGFFAFGTRLTGEVFTAETIRFLTVTITYLSILIEDAFLFQDIVIQEESQKIILDNVPTGIIVLDNTYHVKIFNKQAELILGKRSKDVLNLSVEHCGAEFASKVKDVIVNRQPINREELFISTLGKWIGMSCDFIKQNNEITWTIVIFQDITSAKEMEKERKRIEHNQYWQQIAQQLSHEIKNPLVAIKTFACLLPEKFSDESFRTEFYKIVNGEIQRLTFLVEKIARLADTEQLTLNKTNCLEILQKVKQRFPSLEITSCDGIDTITKADATRLQEALELLLDFCVQDAGEQKNIEISLTSQEGSIEISIMEPGNNIKCQPGQDLFTPFSNQFSTLLSLNLAICRKIIEEHSGRIFSEILPGSKKFVIKLPVSK